MLCTLFRIVDEFEFSGFVCFWRCTTWTRTSQWTDSDFLAFGRIFLAHQDFWRCAHHMGVAQVVVIHIRARVERTQGAVKRQRACRKFFMDALPHLHLHEVARSDQLFGALDCGQVIGLGKTALDTVAGTRRDRRCNCRRSQTQLEFFQTCLRLGVCLWLCRIGIHHQRQLAREVVDHCQFFALQQQNIGHA